MPFISILVYINSLILLVLLLNCLKSLSINKSKTQELSDQISHLEGMLWKISTILEMQKKNAASGQKATPAEQPQGAPEAKPAEQPQGAPEAKPAEQPQGAPEAKPAEQQDAPEAKPAEQPKAAPEKPVAPPPDTTIQTPGVTKTVPGFLLKKDSEAETAWPSDVKRTGPTPTPKPETASPTPTPPAQTTGPETSRSAPQGTPGPAPKPAPDFSSERITSAAKELEAERRIQQALSPIEARTRETLAKMWQWFIVGEEYRPGGSTKEYAVATTWMLRAAVILLVLGLAYFIKYSHERNLLPPELRLSVAVVFALAIIGTGCKLLNGQKYRVIGTALAGVGFAGLYLCVFASVSIYHLLDVWVGLAGMVVLTAAGAALALRFDSMFLAMLAVCGGFLAPILMNTGSRNLVGLFGYMTVLVAGALVVARRRSWQALNVLAFLFTWGIYIASKPFPHSTGPHSYVEPLTATAQWASIGADVNRAYFIAAGFATLFFLAFCVQTVAYNLFTCRKVSLLELSFAALNGIVFLSVTLPPTILIYGREYAAIVTFSGALVYLVQVSLLRRAKMEDRSLLLTLLVFSCGLIALTFPLLLKQDHLAVAWSVQAAAMLYIACRTNSVILARLSYVVYMIAAIRLLGFDLAQGYARHMQDFWTRLTNFGSYTAALAGGFFMLKRYAGELLAERSSDATAASGAGSRYPRSAKVMFWCAFAVSFIMIAGEFTYWEHLKIGGIIAAGALYLMVMALIPRLFREDTNAIVMTASLLLGLYIVYVIVRWQSGGESVQDALWRLFPNIWAVAGLAAAGSIFGRLGREADTSADVAKDLKHASIFFIVTAMAFWFAYSTDELHFLVKQHFRSPEGARIAVSLLWGFYALLLLAFGIIREKKAVRIAALVLFAVTVLKIFFLDLAGTPALYRIAGCMVTGAALVAGAWLYARFEQKGDSSDEPRP